MHRDLGKRCITRLGVIANNNKYFQLYYFRFSTLLFSISTLFSSIYSFMFSVHYYNPVHQQSYFRCNDLNSFSWNFFLALLLQRWCLFLLESNIIKTFVRTLKIETKNVQKFKVFSKKTCVGLISIMTKSSVHLYYYSTNYSVWKKIIWLFCNKRKLLKRKENFKTVPLLVKKII